MDLDDYDTPIKKKINNDYFMFLSPLANISKYKKVKLRENFTNLQDNRFLPNPETKKFYDIVDITSDVLDYSDLYPVLANIDFVIDSTFKTYSRSSFTFFDVIAQIGGIFEIGDLFGVLFIAWIAEKLMFSSIVSSLYTVKSNSELDGSHHPSLERSKREFNNDGLFRSCEVISKSQDQITPIQTNPNPTNLKLNEDHKSRRYLVKLEKKELN